MSSSIQGNYYRHSENASTVSNNNRTSQEEANKVSGTVGIECTQLNTTSHLKKSAWTVAARKQKRNARLLAVSSPPEILVTIFEFACFPREKHENGFVTHIDVDFWREKSANFRFLRFTRLGPFFISRVCSVWRQVALGTPQLWNTIKLAVDCKFAKKQAALLQYWLLNAGQRPLTVGLTDHKDFEEEHYESPTEVIDVLAPYAHRLQTAELTMASKWAPALIHIGKHASLLSSLTLHKSYEVHPIAHVPFFSGAPKLCDVTLIGYGIMDVLLPSTQIERLHANTFDGIDPIGGLRLYPKLKYCKLNTEYCKRHLSVSMPLMHNTLPSLELRLEKHTDLIAILNPLTLPSLRSFILNLYSGIPPMSLLLSFFLRCSCALETLHLDGMTISENDTIACLQALPGLLNLRLEPSHDSSLHNGALSWRVLDLMNPRKCANEMDGMKADELRGNGQCLVPNLESLFFHGNIQFNQHMLVEFLADRWDGQHVSQRSASPVARLRSAQIITAPMKFNEDDALILCRLRQEGMQVKIVGYSGYSTKWID